jgi:STE24 endopeptidase
MQMMLFLGITVAVVRALRQGDWMIGGVLAALALSAVICPLADAAVSRRAEFTADRFAADHGLARELAAALRALNDASGAAPGWSRRLLASHLSTELRISALLTVSAGS